MAQIGQIVDGNFRILQFIEKGGMSNIYLAKDKRLSKLWVVKEIPKSVRGKDNSLFIRAALKEADIIKSLDHPGIVRIVNIIEDSEAIYLIEDYVSGKSLRQIIDQGINPDESMLIDWAVQTTEILIYLHSRTPPVIYRDLKPENLILSESGHIRLIDFGIARQYHPDKRKDTVYLGTKRYAAPEQYEEYGAQTDNRTDIYGLGKTMQALLQYCPSVSSGFQTIIQRCIENDPADRYQNADSLLSELKALSKHKNKKRLLRPFRFPIKLLIVIASVCIFLSVGTVINRIHMPPSMDQLLSFTEEIGSDHLFSKEEEEQLLNTILPYLSEIKEKEEFKELAYKIGLLYWNYYEYGAGQLAGRNASVKWFEMADNYNHVSVIYAAIGNLNIKIRNMINDYEDTSCVLNCFEQMSYLSDFLMSDLEESLKEDICVLVADNLETYIQTFFSGGIHIEDLNTLYQILSDYIDQTETISDKDKSIKEQISKHLEAIDLRLRQLEQDV